MFFFQFADEHAKLAGPAGVPMSSMLSAGTDEPEAAVDPSYGVNNPFLEDQGSAAAAQPQQYYDASGQLTTGDPSQQYYGAGYSQAQSGYSSAGYGKITLDHALGKCRIHSFLYIRRLETELSLRPLFSNNDVII